MASIDSGSHDNSLPLTIICLPYAGGTSAIFSKWHNYFPKEVEIHALDYPGHGKKFHEPLKAEIKEIVRAILPELPDNLSNTYLYGHSLGAIIAFEMVRLLHEKHKTLPKHLIVSGANSPTSPNDEENIGHLPDNEFLSEMQNRYKGFTQEILEQNELLQILIPIVRADVIASETYIFKKSPKIPCPITAIAGTEDKEIKLKKLVAWENLTSKQFNHLLIPGDHLSLFNNPLSLINAFKSIKIVNT